MARGWKLLICVLIVALLAAATQLTTPGRIAGCAAATIVGLRSFTPGCLPIRQYVQGRRLLHRDPRGALGVLTDAAHARPAWASACLEAASANWQ